MSIRRLTALALGFVVLLAASVAVGAAPRTHAASSSTSVLQTVEPTRFADTRTRFGTNPAGRLAAGTSLRVAITGRPELTVPIDAVAVVLNVTADNAGGAGYVTVYPGGASVPEASNLNPTGPGFSGANLATVGLGADGTVEIFSSVATDVLVDIAGYYRPSGAAAAGRLVPTGPTRSYDTRTAGGRLRAGEFRPITLSAVPPGAAAAIVNVTAVNTSAAGFWSVVGPGSRLDGAGVPTTSTLNTTAAGQTVAGQAIVPIGADRQVSVYTSGGGDLVVDVFGYVTGGTAPVSADGLFVPLAGPYRMLDTRTANSPMGAGRRTWPGWTIETPIAGRGGVPSVGVAAIVGNLTSVDPHEAGWAAAFAAGVTFPGTSNLNNGVAGTVVPNHALVPVSDRGVSLLAAAGGHLLLDAAGYITGPPVTTTTGVPVNVMPLPRFPMTLSIPAIGLRASLQEDSQEADLRFGPGWWPGTSYPGVSGNMAIFGHRTEETAPFRNLNRLRAGHTITITGDHRTSTYVVDAWRVVPAAEAEDWIGPSDGTILTLIACSRPDGTPTSLSYRIIVTATLQSYTDA